MDQTFSLEKITGLIDHMLYREYFDTSIPAFDEIPLKKNDYNNPLNREIVNAASIIYDNMSNVWNNMSVMDRNIFYIIMNRDKYSKDDDFRQYLPYEKLTEIFRNYSEEELESSIINIDMIINLFNMFDLIDNTFLIKLKYDDINDEMNLMFYQLFFSSYQLIEL